MQSEISLTEAMSQEANKRVPDAISDNITKQIEDMAVSLGTRLALATATITREGILEDIKELAG